MQAELEPSELAYVLDRLGAQQVVGINNEQVLPREPTLRTAQLELGFARLQEHGWFVTGEGGIDANDFLMLMVAVVAEPEYTLVATRYLEGNARQMLCYYVNQGIIVEQFQAAHGNYVLSRLASSAALAERLQAAFGALLAAPERTEPRTFALPVFAAALAKARGDAAESSAMTIHPHDAGAELEALARTLRSLHPVGRIEGTALGGETLGAWHELALMGHGSEAKWLVRQDVQADTITLWPADDKQLARLVEELVAALSAETARPAVVGR